MADATTMNRFGVRTEGLPRRERLADVLQGRAERLDVRALWRLATRQSLAMWLVQAYIMLEYVRPQTIYPWLDFAPWPLIVIIGALISCLAEGRLAFSARSLWVAIIAFTFVVFLSSLAAYSPIASWESKDIWINWLLMMLIVGGGVRDRRELLLLLVAFGLWNLKMTQHGVRGWISIGFAFRAIGIGGAPGWFQNSGEFGIQMCIFLPLVSYYAYGVWPSLGKKAKVSLLAISGSALFSIVASSSRGALVGAACIGLWALWRNPQRMKVLAVVVIGGAALWSIVPAESKARFGQMGEDQSSTTRLTYWKHGIEIANDHPVLGVGYKNWMPYYTANYNPKGQLPHNYAIEAVSELGYLGLACLVVVFVAYFRATALVRKSSGPTAAHPDRLLWSLGMGLDGAMLGFIVSGSFVSVLYYPFIWMNVALVMALVRVESKRQKDLRLSGLRGGVSTRQTKTIAYR